MSQTLTVVVPSHDPGAALSTLVTGLDDQTLRTDRFDIVVADAGSTDGSLARLERLARSRPHLSVLTDADLAAGVAAATGAYVLVVEPGTRVLPEALARMAAAADTENEGADIVIGRRRLGHVAAAGPLSPPSDPAALVAPLDPALVAQSVDAALLVRRRLLLDAVTEDPEHWAARCLERADRLALVTDYACLLTPSTRRASSSLRLAPADLRWSGSTLRIELSARVVGGTAPTDGYALALGGRNGTEHLLPTDCTLTPAEPSEPDGADPSTASTAPATLTVVTEIDCAAGVAPVPDGSYRVRLRVGGPDGGLRAIRAATPVSALLGGRPVALRTADDGNLDLDLGARTDSLVSTFPSDRAAVTESARGSLLRVPFPELHVAGTGTLPGIVSLGGLRLPAELVGSESVGVELRCYVSGLEGRSTLGVRFGGGAVVATGCDLVMSHLGLFAVEPTPPGAPSPEPHPEPVASNGVTPSVPEPASAKAPSAAAMKVPASPSAAQRLRRAVPEPLEPAVRALVRFAPARALYRRLLRR